MGEFKIWLIISFLLIILRVNLVEAPTDRQFGSEPFTFVVSPYIPMIQCEIGDTNLENMDGADIMLLRYILH